MVVVALADQGAGQLGLADGPVHLRAGLVEDLRPRAGNHGPVALVEIADAFGQRRQRQGVGADEHLAVAIADRQRAAAPRADHQVMLAGEHDGQRKGALEARQCLFDGLARRGARVEMLGQQRGDGLRVRVALEIMPGRRELGAQLLEILDDPVMDHRHPRGRMGMRVGLVRHPVGGPARVADPDIAIDRVFFEDCRQVGQLALGTAAMDRAVDERRDPGGIIAAVFEALQPLDQARDRVVGAQNADDAAHIRSSPTNRAGPHTSTGSA